MGVILFHLKYLNSDSIVFLPGGYLGVDVFFALSGYLITKNILKSLKDNKFSFGNFFSRRARRILPALSIVLIISYPLAWLYLLPEEFFTFAESVLSSLFFYSNFQFWLEDPYWNLSKELKPLLHTWSLAVEEQFYFLLPVILVGLFKFGKRALIGGLCLLFFVSFLSAIYFTPITTNITFYLLPFRLWEFILAGMIAWFEIEHKERNNSIAAFTLAPLGLLGIIGSFLFLSERTQHPYWATLIPIFSTLVIIHYAQSNKLVTRILSCKPLVWIGLISYPLYLWHYPIFIFAKASEIQMTWVVQTFLIFSVFLLAQFTYVFLEVKIRFTNWISNKSFFKIEIALFVFLSIFSYLAIETYGFKQRLPELNELYGKLEPNNRILSYQTWDYARKKNRFIDHFKNRILIIGDSHAKDTYNGLMLNRSLLPDYDMVRTSLSFAFEKTSSCFVQDPKQWESFFESEIFQSASTLIISDFLKNDHHLACLELFLSKINLKKKKVILFSSLFFSMPNQYKELVLAKIDPLRKKNRLVDLYFKRIPIESFTLVDWAILSKGELSLEDTQKLQFVGTSNWLENLNKKLPQLARKYGINYIDHYDYLCNKQLKSCDTLTNNGNKIYFDHHHLSLEGARYVGEKLIQNHLIPILRTSP